MATIWQREYLEDIEEWLNHLSHVQLKSVAKELKLLELCGNRLTLPHSRALGGLFELRTSFWFKNVLLF